METTGIHPSNSISHEGYISKISENGTWEWVTSLGHTLGPFSIEIDSADQIVVAYSNRGTKDGIVSKFTESGSLVSTISFASSHLYLTSMAIDESDNIYLSGYWSGNTYIGQFSLSSSVTEFLIMKINNSGSIDWVQTPTSAQSTNWIWDINLDNNFDLIRELSLGNNLIFRYWKGQRIFGEIIQKWSLGLGEKL